MTENEILAVLSDILATLLGQDVIALEMETIRDDVDGWDSFIYVNFMAIVEQELDVTFDATDIEGFTKVGEIVQKVVALKDS